MRFSASLRLRPMRIGFLVNPRNFDAVRRCIQLNTCFWGGLYNPIIPVFDRSPARWHLLHFRPKGRDIGRGYMRFFEPDVVVEAETGLAAKVGWKPGERYLNTARLISLDELITKDQAGRTNFATGVDITAIHGFLYQKEFKYQLKREEKFAIMKGVSEKDAFFDAVVGVFPDNENLRYIEENYREAFQPTELSRSSDTFLSLMQEPVLTPFRFTRYGLNEDYSGHSDLRFFVFDPSDSQDLIDFWNLRQFDRDVIPIHIQWFERCVPMMRDYIEKNFRSIPGNPFGTMFQATVQFARSIEEEGAEALINEHLRNLPQGSVTVQFWYESIWEHGDERFISRPKCVRLTAETSGIDENIIGANLHITFLTPVLEFLKDGHWYNRATWMNVIQPSEASSDTDELATVYPTNTYNPVFPRIRLDDWAAISREGWLFPERHIGHSVYAQLQLGRDAFSGWFATHDIRASPSDAGRVAEQIIRAAGGLRSCAMFADEAVVKLLDDMAATRVLRNRGATRVPEESNFPDRAAPLQRWERLFNSKAATRRMRWITLERFTEKPILRAGLEIKCPHCAQRNWFDVKTLDYTLVCTRCLQEFSFPQAASNLNKLRWLYRVIGPFATPDFARGGYAVALALRTFAHGVSVGDRRLTWTTGLELDLAEKKVEIDFAAWCQYDRLFRDSEEPILVIGEAKSFAEDAITQRSIDDLKLVARRFPGAFIAVAVLKAGFSLKEKARLISLAKWGRRRSHEGWPINPLIVLTGTELFAERYV
jgi:hypothetical protein